MGTRSIRSAFVALLALAGGAGGELLAGQDVTLALVGGRILDGYGGPLIEDGVILVAADRIVAVGTRDAVQVPDGVHVLSTEGMTVLPGLIDMHSHLCIRDGMPLH